MTAGDAPGAHPAAANETVLVDRLLGVPRTGGLVATAGGQPCEEHAICPDRTDPDPTAYPSHWPAGPPSTPPLRRTRRTAPTSASWSAPTSAGRAMMRTSQPGWNDGAIALSATRRRRRTRLRTTAPPSLRPVDNPNRVVPRSVRLNLAWRSVWDREVPSRCSAAKSCGRESITSRGESWPRPSVRPSAASDPEPAGRPELDGLRWSSSGRGNHAPLRDGAFWAGRSASWGCRAILSTGLGVVMIDP
jgi:hypothetical protein